MNWISSMYTFIPSLLHLPPTQPHPTHLGHHRARAELPVLYSRFPLAIYFTHGSVYMSFLISQFVPPSPSPAVVTCRFSMSVSVFLPCKYVHLYHFSRFHIHALIYDFFSLSDLLHSVWQTLGLSTSLQMTRFCSFLWLSNIPLYICATSSLSIHPSMDT